MTVTMERAGRRERVRPVIGPPQVNLLPPVLRARRAVRRAKRVLAAALAGLVAVLTGGYALATHGVDVAQAELAAAQSQTARLTADQGQYAEVPTVLNSLALLREARAQGLSTDVTWAPYLRAILAVLPPGVSLSSLDVSGGTPMGAAASTGDPLHGPSVGRILFTGSSATVPDTAAWLDALDSIPGFSDAWVSSVKLTTDATGATRYEVSSSVQVTGAAYSHRFDLTGGS